MTGAMGMKLNFDYGTEKIEFNVVYKKRKTILIEVEAPKAITVVAPQGTSNEEILKIVSSKSKWIIKKLFEIREMEHRRRERQYVNGESFIYMGRNYSLQIVLDENIKFPEAKLYRGKFYIHTNKIDGDIIRKSLENWYRDKAKEKIIERIQYYQPNFDCKPKKVVIKDQQKRWGSCNKNHELRFNWRSIMAPSPILDYIVVHEMCHMVYMNHLKEFWNLLKSILPDYEERKNFLRNNGIKYDL